MRNTKICKKCKKFKDCEESIVSGLFTCDLDNVYCDLNNFVLLEVPEDCDFRLEQLVVTQTKKEK